MTNPAQSPRSPVCPLLDKSRLQALLADNPLVGHFYCHAAVDSTMARGRALVMAAEGHSAAALHGTLIIAEEQTAGRGRHGRCWSSPPGASILATVILSRSCLPGACDAAQLTRLAAAVPVAVRAGIAKLLPQVRIKFPNDLVVEGRKLGGILLEVCGDAVLAGFGVNCMQETDSFPPDLKMPATSLFLETGLLFSREELLSFIMAELAAALETGFFSAAGDAMREYCETLGTSILVDMGELGVEQGIARTITPEGMLGLETASGLRYIHTAQVVRTWPADL